MKTYETYKDSGIEWIGDIPEHWEVKPVKHNFKFTTGFTPPTGKREFYDNGEHIWINISDLQGKYISDSEKKITDKAIKKYKPEIVKTGSLLYSFKLSVGRVGFVTKDCYTNEAIFSIEPREDTNLNFFYYSLPEQIIKNANENIYGAKILNQELIKNATLIVPSSEEQTAIANYLDNKTAEIDQLIADKKQLVALYQEEKTAIINQAVTKGINPDVELKDSGIEWLGDIPEHWAIKKLKYVFKSLNSVRIPLSASERGKMTLRKYDYYGASGVIDKVEDYLFEEPLMLIGEDGANLLTRTKRLVFLAKGKYWVNNHAHILKVINGVLEYYCELLELYDFTIWVSGSAQPKLTSENLMNIEVIVPPINEQTKIIQYIDKESARIDAKITKAEQYINLLTEYRTALISEVVTGKIKVID
ncbi:restriction endonuclease subunit S [Winogradskyella sp. MH6]|uniref:restriction endonuclease subunit S n=1 Tax=Winogradskyella sp. MH6 TaxID=2929510 RepID=UPI001FB2E0DD|nr:restriction endonuclease subunit S [Winogradskyella sp. MH6]